MKAFVHLNSTERDCVRRYVSLLAGRLGENLIRIYLFGSAARGDMWSDRMPMRSDIDLLVLTQGSVPKEAQEALVNETYPLFLECGRQVAPQFRTVGQFETPEGRHRWFVEQVRAEGRAIYETIRDRAVVKE